MGGGRGRSQKDGRKEIFMNWIQIQELDLTTH